jgi:hypothetical protein
MRCDHRKSGKGGRERGGWDVEDARMEDGSNGGCGWVWVGTGEVGGGWVCCRVVCGWVRDWVREERDQVGWGCTTQDGVVVEKNGPANKKGDGQPGGARMTKADNRNKFTKLPVLSTWIKRVQFMPQ